MNPIEQRQAGQGAGNKVCHLLTHTSHVYMTFYQWLMCCSIQIKKRNIYGEEQ
jgi:hypothetical protein